MKMAVHILKRCIYDHIKTTNNLDKPNHQKKSRNYENYLT